MRKNPHVRICGGLGSATTLVYPTVARLRGDGTRDPLLLMAHTDVVNVDPEKWTFPPFSATRDGEYVYGRGTVEGRSTTRTTSQQA